jgi:hypothetical protein
VYCASADWMQRNFFRRVETCFPIQEKRAVSRLVSEGLEPYLVDNVQAWSLGSDGKYKRARPGKEQPCSAQDVLLERICGLPVDAEPLVVERVAPGLSPKKRIEAAQALEDNRRKARRSQNGAAPGRRVRSPAPHALEPLRPQPPPAPDERETRRRA